MVLIILCFGETCEFYHIYIDLSSDDFDLSKSIYRTVFVH